MEQAEKLIFLNQTYQNVRKPNIIKASSPFYWLTHTIENLFGNYSCLALLNIPYSRKKYLRTVFRNMLSVFGTSDYLLEIPKNIRNPQHIIFSWCLNAHLDSIFNKNIDPYFGLSHYTNQDQFLTICHLLESDTKINRDKLLAKGYAVLTKKKKIGNPFHNLKLLFKHILSSGLSSSYDIFTSEYLNG
jgi:hypothetical protein